MIDIKREQERGELYRSIWSIADKLRGSIDGWDFKTYVLGMMFYRYISENIENYINYNNHIKYSCLSDCNAMALKDEVVKYKGFFILPSQLFCNLRKKCSLDLDLSEELEYIFKKIEDSSKGTPSEINFVGLFKDMDFKSNKLGSTILNRNKSLVNLIEGVAMMKLQVQENVIDAFGDAYEYLMSMYASNAGKSGGEFFTPQEVSELLVRLVVVNKNKINNIYDPCCGSGSLLLKAIKVLGKNNIKNFYGQEINLTTYNLCRINMFLHDVHYNSFFIYNDNTLLQSYKGWEEGKFDAVVSNPPYSIKWEGDSNPNLIKDKHFSKAGVLAPKAKADLAFIMHSLYYLEPNGTAAIVCFPGVLYRGSSEKKIREYLVESNVIDCIIQLPSNLFFGTSISTCIMILKKNKNNKNILFVDASKEFIKVGNTNKLTSENINHIVNIYSNYENKKYLATLVSSNEVKNQDYNLSVSIYVKQENTNEIININKVNSKIQEILKEEDILRKKIDHIIKDL